MNGKDKISVIIPCYNVQKYIMRCFDSIYSQTYGFENLEVILIDDLSTDNTWSILESLQRQYPENVISLKIQKKGKCGGARNLGMDICTGKYITFVDADDYVHPDMLRVLYDRMTEDDRHRPGNPRKLWTGARRNSGACGPFQRGRHG